MLPSTFDRRVVTESSWAQDSITLVATLPVVPVMTMCITGGSWVVHDQTVPRRSHRPVHFVA
jgi:hypothetical protein